MDTQPNIRASSLSLLKSEFVFVFMEQKWDLRETSDKFRPMARARSSGLASSVVAADLNLSAHTAASRMSISIEAHINGNRLGTMT